MFLFLFFLLFQNPFEGLIANLLNTIPDGWTVDATRKNVRLTLLSPFENVSVSQSITWNGDKINIFVHNRELPKDNFVWNSINSIDYNDITDISEYVPKLCCLVQSSQICKGVRLYK